MQKKNSLMFGKLNYVYYICEIIKQKRKKQMPKIYEYFGLVFYIYTRGEHNPAHIHIKYNGTEAKVNIEYDNGRLVDPEIKKVFARKMIPESRHAEIRKFIKIYHEDIAEKWQDIFYKNKTPKCTVIKKRV